MPKYYTAHEIADNHNDGDRYVLAADYVTLEAALDHISNLGEYGTVEQAIDLADAALSPRQPPSPIYPDPDPIDVEMPCEPQRDPVLGDYDVFGVRCLPKETEAKP